MNEKINTQKGAAMGRRRITAVFLVVGLTGAALLAQGPHVAQPGPTSGPAFTTPVALDSWLPEQMMAELERYAATGEYRELERRTAEALLARMACWQIGRLDPFNDLVYVLGASRFLPAAENTAGGKDFTLWLVRHPELARRLVRALHGVKSVGDSFDRLLELKSADEDAVLAYPDLAVAFATAEPLGHYRGQESPASLVECFRWFARGSVRFRYDVRQMPFELSQYLADSRLSIKDRQWAVDNYGRKSEPARAYFDLRYDDDYYQKGAPKKIEALPYTLENLRKVGGVCIDQAYYAAEICKTLGIPAAIVTGCSSGGTGHAWVAHLKLAAGGRSAHWDSYTGRYASQSYYVGAVTEPASKHQMTDSELMLVGSAALLPLSRREGAATATTLALMADACDRSSVEPQISILEELADAFDRGPTGRAKRRRADRRGLKAQRQLDLRMTEELIGLAIKANLAYHGVWDLIIKLREDGRLPVDHLDRYFDILVGRTAQQYPEYSWLIVSRIAPTIEDPLRREAVYKRSLAMYGGRPDLQGRLLIALGDDYLARDKKDEALAVFGMAAEKSLNVAEVVLDAAERAEKVLADMGKSDMAIGMYARLFDRTPAPSGMAAFLHSQTSHFQLGVRLAKLLDEAGRAEEARRVRQELGLKDAG